jgi:segregation and condensation protein B
LRRLLQTPVETRLSPPAMETLAVIAYRQPVQRSEVEAIRGVQCGDLLRQLMDRDLARIVGRTDELGRPLLYGTTKRFLQVFGLRHLDELPRAATLRRPAPVPTATVNEPPSNENDIASAPRRFSPGDGVGMIADPKPGSRKHVG